MALDLFQRTMDVARRPRFEEATRLPIEWSESFNTAWSHGVLFDQSFAIMNARNAAIDDVINEAYGQTRDDRFRLESIAAARKGGERMLDLYNARVGEALKLNPDLDLRPLSDDELDVRAADKARVARDEFKAMQAREKTWGGAFGTFAGGAAAAIFDPVNLVTFPLAAPRALGVLKTGLAWGGIGAGTQAAIEVTGAQFREQVEPGYLRSGEPAENILGAAAFAGGIGAGLKALGNSWRYLKTREWLRTIRDAGNVVESEAQVADTNPFRGVEGEVAHREALSKTVDDVVAGRPAAVDRVVTPEVMATYEGRITPIMKARQATLEAQQTAELLAREEARLPPTMERLSEQQLAEIRTAADEIGAGLTSRQAALAEGVTAARTAATEQATTVERLRREVEELRGDLTARQAEGRPTAAAERSLAVRERQLTKAQAKAAKLATAAEERAAREPLRQVTAEARAATGKKRAESELRLALGRLAEQGYGLRLAPGEVQAMAARIMAAPADEIEIVLRETTEALVERAKAARATAEPLPLGAPLRPHEEQRAAATRLSNLMRTRIQTLAREVGYAMPRDEAQIIAARLLTANEGESLAILDELVVRPRTLAKTINEPPPDVPPGLPSPPLATPPVPPAGGAAALPPPKPGFVRFFHGGPPEGGQAPTTGGGRWTTTDFVYARDYRADEGRPGQVWYVDIPKGDPTEIKARQWDETDEKAGTNMVGRYASIEVPEQWAKQMKPVPADLPSAPEKNMKNIPENLPRQPPAAAPADAPAVPSWLQQVRQEAIDFANRIGVTDKIRQMAIEGKTAAEISKALGERLSVDDVRAVRDSLGIAPAGPQGGIGMGMMPAYEAALARQLTPGETAKLRTDPEMTATLDRDLQRMRAETPDKEVPIGRDAEGNPVTRTVEDMADEVEQRRLAAEEIKATCGPQPETKEE